MTFREIKRYQKSTKSLLRKISFQKLIKEIAHNLDNFNLRFQTSIVKVIHKTCEYILMS